MPLLMLLLLRLLPLLLLLPASCLLSIAYGPQNPERHITSATSHIQMLHARKRHQFRDEPVAGAVTGNQAHGDMQATTCWYAQRLL